MDKLFHVAWHMKGHVFMANSEMLLYISKKDMMQLFWIMKEFN
jgi:hypothetical protein